MSSLADDLLPGAKAIARYIFQKADKKTQRKIYHKFQTKQWPIWKDGNELISRKSLLDAHFNPPTV